MNITLKQAVKRDYFQVHQYYMQFRDEYSATGAVVTDLTTRNKADLLEEMRRGAIHMILIDDKPAGFVDFCMVSDIQTGKWVYSTIQNMYIEPEFRGQGAAQQVRTLARKNLKALSVMITYRRARELADYYAKQGFCWVRVYSEFEPAAHDEALCLVLTDQQRDIELSKSPGSVSIFRRMDYYGVVETQQVAEMVMQRRFG